jgi:hypothetical protein
MSQRRCQTFIYSNEVELTVVHCLCGLEENCYGDDALVNEQPELVEIPDEIETG